MRIAVKLAVIVAFIITAGTLGYVILSGCPPLDAFYMTVTTIATVGYSEFCPVSPATRVYTSLLILSSFILLGYVASRVATTLTSGEIGKILKRRRFMKELKDMRGHFIVCGASGPGIHLIKELLSTRRKVVLIDINEKTAEEVEKEYGIIYVIGDARHERNLIEANIKDAEGIAVCLPQDSDNMLIVITARYLFPGIKIVARVNEDENIHKFERVGADWTVSDKIIGGLRMASYLVRPATVGFLDMMLRGEETYRFEDFKVTDEFIGKSIKDIFYDKNMLAIAMKRNDRYIYNPRGDTRLESGDTVVILTQPANVSQ